MKRLCIVPNAIPCTFAELPPGLFIAAVPDPQGFGIGIKDEYDGKGYNEAGEYWCSDVLVIPCGTEVFDDEE